NSIRVVRLLGEVLAALKELTLKGNENDVPDVVADRRSKAPTTRAVAHYYNQMPRVLPAAGTAGRFVTLRGVGYLGGLPDAGPTAAMTSVALFAVAGSRLVPSLTRFQSTQNRILTNAAFADYIIDDIEFAREAVERKELPDSDTLEHGLH